MATNGSSSPLTDQEELPERVAGEVVVRRLDAGFVQWGEGVALVLAYSPHRCTTDVHFDAEEKTDMTRLIHRNFQLDKVVIAQSTRSYVFPM